MFPFFKKKQKTWIDQPVIDYLMGISSLFVIYYSVRINGRDTHFKFRDERGNFLADIYDTRVNGVSIGFQGSTLTLYTYRVYQRLNADELPKIKEYFDSKIKDYPTTQSRLDINQLTEIQGQFKQQLEDTLQVQSVQLFPPVKYDTTIDNNIRIYVNCLSELQRERFTRFLNRLDGNCIHVEVNMYLNYATEEEITATQTELDMLEMVEETNEEEEEY
jgi:hypothetical protein